MRITLLIATLFTLLSFNSGVADAEVWHFAGTLEVVASSGKACADRKDVHQISLVYGSEHGSDAVFGYVGGDALIAGQISGTSPDILTLRYPYPEAERAEGHTLRLEINGDILHGELRDRHLDATVDDCNFDLAQLKMNLVNDEAAAHKVYQRLSLQYEAQLARLSALSILRTGAYADAIHVFERALALADKLYPPDSEQLFPYLTGLANSYMRAGRNDDFNNLYNSRIGKRHNETVLQVYNQHQLHSLLQVGRAAMGREDYQTALYNFKQALRIDYKNKEAIAATMSALVRSGQHDGAILFLEETERKLGNNPERKDLRGAIAQVEYLKAINEHKAGRSVEAVRSLRKAIKLDPDTTQYPVVLARWIHKSGRFSEADTVLKRAIESFKDELRRKELSEAREKLRLNEMILAKIRRAGD